MNTSSTETMFAHYPVPWQRTIGIHLAFGQGASSEQGDEKGLTHIAEHLCFSGTNTLSEPALAEKIGKYFWHFDAITSGERVRFCCLAEQRYFEEAVETLAEMVFRWNCAPQQWDKEKSELTEEAREYRESEEAGMFRRKKQLLKDVIPLDDSQLSPDETARLEAGTVHRAKAFWDNLIEKAPRSLTLLGELPPARQDFARHALLGRRPATGNKTGTDTMPEWGFVQGKAAFAFWRKGAAPHFLALLLNEIFLLRAAEDAMEIEFIEAQPATAWIAHGTGEPADGGTEAAIFRRTVTEPEFTHAKSLLLRFWDRCRDGIGGEISLEWLSRFTEGGYAPLFSPDAEAYRKMLIKLSFNEFKLFYAGSSPGEGASAEDVSPYRVKARMPEIQGHLGKKRE